MGHLVPVPGVAGAGRRQQAGAGVAAGQLVQQTLAVGRLLMPALQRLQPVAELGLARGQLQLMLDLAVQTLQLIALPGHLRAFARHLHFHLPHLLHQGFLVFLELPAFVFQLLVQGQ